MSLPILTLKAGHMERILHGHPWVFSNELAEVPKGHAPGTLVEVKNPKGPSLGLGFFNPHQLVAVRLLHLGLDDGPPGEQLTADFFVKRLTEARELREHLWGSEEARVSRLCFGESDGLPGLVVDRFGTAAVAEILSAGMEAHRGPLTEALKTVFPEITGVLLRHDSALRALEGLPVGGEEVLYGEVPQRVSVVHEGMKLDLAMKGQQKTGYFLDQRENRRTVRQLSKGLRVLDICTNQGGFAIQAALGGATAVTGVDSSAEALAAARGHVAANGATLAATAFEWVESDMFRFLETATTRRDKWDLVVVDPPAFAKSKKKASGALHGYERLNGLALKVVKSGGFLATGSCSMHIDEARFFQTLSKAAREQQKRLVQIRQGHQAADHPVLAAMPETRYLKWATYKVMSPY